MSVSEHLKTIEKLAEELRRPIRIMEVCGTHTMTAFRSGLRSLLPGNITLVSGPGCPVCVTPEWFIDRAIRLARLPDVIIATFGDLMRVPGAESSLETERARGATIKTVYSAGDALMEAERRPDHKVIFLGVGFETTAPTVAWTLRKAAKKGANNFLTLCAHKTMPHAMAALLAGKDMRIDGFLCPGHVSAIIGCRPYGFIAREHLVPCVISGFEPADMIASIEMILRQLADGRAEVQNQYVRGAGEEGNTHALNIMSEVFEECDAEWRGLGTISNSGLRIRQEFRAHDAEILCPDHAPKKPHIPSKCICGDILKGIRTPPDCPLFGTECTPASPSGACMVSSEGTCAAYYRYDGKSKIHPDRLKAPL